MIFKIVFLHKGKIIQEQAFDYKYPEDWESLMWPNDDYSTLLVPEGFKVNTIKFKLHLNEIDYYLKIKEGKE